MILRAPRQSSRASAASIRSDIAAIVLTLTFSGTANVIAETIRNLLRSLSCNLLSAGIVQTQYPYEPFGKTTATGANDTNSQKYTGREDDGTELYYYRARHYSPALHRFISEDPIGLSGGDTNLYAYVGNSPIMFTDPAGLERPNSAAGTLPSQYRPIGGSAPAIGGRKAEENKQWWNDFWEDFRTGHRARDKNLNMHRSFARRWWDGFNATNTCIPGVLAPTGMGLMTGGATAEQFGLVSFLPWAKAGFGGMAAEGAQFTALETGLIVAQNSALNFCLVGLTWEAGVAIGSAINAGLIDTQ